MNCYKLFQDDFKLSRGCYPRNGVWTKRTSSSALDRVPAVRRGKVRCNSSSLKGNKPRPTAHRSRVVWYRFWWKLSCNLRFEEPPPNLFPIGEIPNFGYSAPWYDLKTPKSANIKILQTLFIIKLLFFFRKKWFFLYIYIFFFNFMT